jgi:uncharacterized repeat protein (TIGR01451 family)
MSPRPRLRALSVAVALALPAVLAIGATSASAATKSGGFAEAYGLLIDATLLQGNVPVLVGPLAPAASSCPPGGTKTAELLAVPASPVATADVLSAAAGTACTTATSSLASAQTLDTTVLEVAAPATVTADAITSRASVTCTTGPVASTQIVNLAVGGTAVPLPAVIPPNFDLLPQVLGPLGLRVILNEQHPAASGRGIVVNGLHVIASGAGAVPVGGAVLRGDVVLSHASAGVVCPGGPGSATGGLPAPDITFAKTGTPASISAGDTVVYAATVKNTSTTPCEVLKLIDHVAPVFTLVSSSGPFGTALDAPAPVRSDGGVDAVLRPTGLTIAPGASLVQRFTVVAKAGAAPGTYYDTLEIYCGQNGNFVSGPLAPVTIVPPAAEPPAAGPPAPEATVETLPVTGGAPLVTVLAVLALVCALGLRQVRTRH